MKLWETGMIAGIVMILIGGALLIESAVNDNFQIRIFDNCHTVVWHDTLWRLEAVKLGNFVKGEITICPDTIKTLDSVILKP